MGAILQNMIALFAVLATAVAAVKKPQNKSKLIQMPQVSDDVRDSLALPKEMKCEGCRAAAYYMCV